MKNLCFTIGNDYIVRQIYLENSVPVKSILKNTHGNMEWVSDGKEPLISVPGVVLEGSRVILEKDAIVFQGDDYEVRWEFRTFDDIPVIESRIGVKGRKRVYSTGDVKDYADGVGCKSHHVMLTTVNFHDRSDLTDCLVEEKNMPLYSRGRTEQSGHIFILQEKITGEECLLVKNAPCEAAHVHKTYADLCIEPISNIHICATGIDTEQLREDEYLYSYPVALGACNKEGSIPLFRKYYEKDYERSRPYIMSNTWGDRNCDKCVCESFILQEIEKAALLGVDVVQIDDGWQSGITANSLLEKNGVWSSGYRQSNPEFWSVNRKKFPEGFDNISKAANEKGILLGLWFSPDNHNDYETWEQDAELMLDFYWKYGIRYFKIDGLNVNNAACERNLLRMFHKVTTESEGNIVFNMDITAEKRFGFLIHRNIGDIFVENRYTDWGNYYPHNTLRNLWELSKYIPADRFQMEVLNNSRNPELYKDILAPAEYDIDYLFASVMAAKPLLWMEMTGLNEESSIKLANIISVYREYREDFHEVIPILERPSGFSITGFKIKGIKQDYVLLFRELSEKEEFSIVVSKVLATNDETIADAINDYDSKRKHFLPVRLRKQRSYLFGICDKNIE